MDLETWLLFLFFVLPIGLLFWGFVIWAGYKIIQEWRGK